MKIKINNKPFLYDFTICYYYLTFDQTHSAKFDDLVSFEKFMSENHPDINLNDLSTKYAKRLESLHTDASNGIYKQDVEYTTLYCFIGGDTLYSSFNYISIQEKMSGYIDGQKKVNDGYIHTFLAQNWSFDQTNSGSYKIRYWYDKEIGGGVYKIHTFKDKVVFEQDDGKVHSMIVSDNYYIHFEGKNKS
jgi:hypothetical protein